MPKKFGNLDSTVITLKNIIFALIDVKTEVLKRGKLREPHLAREKLRHGFLEGAGEILLFPESHRHILYGDHTFSVFHASLLTDTE